MERHQPDTEILAVELGMSPSQIDSAVKRA
jgi:hypothetical protein